jgi:hypothetical protein
MSVNRSFSFSCAAGFPPIALAPNIASERSFLDPPMHSRFFKGFQSRRLCVGQTRFGATFRKSPAATPAGPNQQKLNSLAPHTVANRRDLFAFA